MKGYRFNLLEVLGKFEGNEHAKKLVSGALKQDLLIWHHFATAASSGLPLYALPEAPPLDPLRFISDATGAAFEWVDGHRKNVTVPRDREVASVGYNEDGPHFIATVKWPERLLISARGTNGARFGCKSTTLEAVGLLLPFLSIPRELRGRHVVLEVDNLRWFSGGKREWLKAM